MRLCKEMAAGDLGDPRLNKRVAKIIEQICLKPAASFPEMAGSDSELEATYRLLNNERVTPESLLAPHYQATVTRCSGAETVVVPHDTTAFKFSTDRDGLGRINVSDHGFLGHFALALDGTGLPLGVLSLITMVRERNTRRPKHGGERRPLAERESRRWIESVENVAGLLGTLKPVHVMDREADWYELFDMLVDGKHRFVIRLQTDRRLEGEGKITDEMSRAATVLCRKIGIAARPETRLAHKKKKHPPREAREARLAVRATALRLRRPTSMPGSAALDVNVVEVREIEPPDGGTPIEWRLVTTEPIDTPEQIAAVVDMYRLRWVIEEFFKALKQGCAVEKRQLESLDALLNALALLAPVAWRLLRLRNRARLAKDELASTVLTPLQIRILERHERTQLKANATIRESLLAIASLGGHIKNNGEPGWQVIGRGLHDLLMMERGAALATANL